MIQSICVCGAGTMGSGIAQAFAQGGFNVKLFDIDKSMLAKARAGIEINLQQLVEKNKIRADEKNTLLSRLSFVDNISACIADIIVEAIIEKQDVKTDLFNRLSSINKKETIFATNTSSLSVSAIAEKIAQPERVIGMHFFNPAPVMKLVEVVSAPHTSENTRRTIIELVRQMGKTAVLCKDSPGFIVNHVARPYYLESLRLAEKGIVDFKTIDRLMEASGFRMGPFALMDLIGNDINYAVSCSVYEAMNKPERLKPSSIQEQKVKNNELGKKTGKGYYDYTKRA